MSFRLPWLGCRLTVGNCRCFRRAGPGPCGAVRLAYLKTEPMLDGLRSEPRFQRLLERMHLM